MSALPTAETIVEWYHSPFKAERAEKPKRRYDSPTKSLEDSIDLTLAYLAAASPPFDQGRPHLIEGLDKKPTLFWTVYERRMKVKKKEDGATRTATTTYYYGFDASGLLTVETVYSESYESLYGQRYTWPLPGTLSKTRVKQIKRHLKVFRKSLIVN